MVRKLIDEDRIGKIIGGVVIFGMGGMESWYLNLVFFYMSGGGLFFDIGFYYVM